MVASGASDRLHALRKAWLKVHRWIALALMIVLIPLGLSGIVLAWDDAIDQALNPHRYAVSGPQVLAPAAYLAAARRVLKPNERIAMLRLPDADGGPVRLMVTTVPEDAANPSRTPAGGPPKRATLYFDPPSARLLDRAGSDAGLVRIAHNFHGSLFVPGRGRAIVGLLGVAMVLLAASGIWLWWPPMGRWTRGFRWRRGDRRLDTNLHHRVGIWIALPLAFQAFTGAWIAWPQMAAMIGLDAGGNRPRPVPIAEPVLQPDAALTAAGRIVPGAPLSITWPTDANGSWRIAIGTGEGPATVTTTVTVEDATGAARISPKPAANSLAAAVRALHDGTTLGFYWRMVMVLIGLAPTVLGITGLLMWLRSRHWRRPHRKHPVPAEAESVAA